MTEFTNGDLMRVMLAVQDKVSHNEGLLLGFMAEVRANFSRDRTDAGAQDDRINTVSSEVAAVKASIARESGQKEGHTEHRNFIGYVITGAASFLAAMAATYSGFFKPH
jgi:hypothetical protein